MTEVKRIAGIVIAMLEDLQKMNPSGTFSDNLVEVGYWVETGTFTVTFIDPLGSFDAEWCERVAMTFVHKIIPKGYHLQVSMETIDHNKKI